MCHLEGQHSLLVWLSFQPVSYQLLPRVIEGIPSGCNFSTIQCPVQAADTQCSVTQIKLRVSMQACRYCKTCFCIARTCTNYRCYMILFVMTAGSYECCIHINPFKLRCFIKLSPVISSFALIRVCYPLCCYSIDRLLPCKSKAAL
jgi:hypothetical protein